MAASSIEKVAFDDFSGGDYGRDWAGQATKNKFRAVNVIPYPGGWVGPRQPLIKFTLPETADALPDKALWFVENEILLMSDGYAWNVKTGDRSLTAQPDVTKLRDFSVSQKQNGEMFCVSSDVATQPSTVIALRAGGLADNVPSFIDRPTAGPTPMPDGLRLGNHQDDDVLASWRQFYWADLNQAVVWDPANFNVVGRVIYDLVDQKNTLVFLIGARDSNTVSSGLDTETRFSHVPGVQVFVVYGTLGAGATFRVVATGPAPEATDTGAFIWNVAGDNVYWFNNRWLMCFDGAQITTQDAPLPRIVHTTSNTFTCGPDAVVNFWSESAGRSQGEFVLAGSLPADTNGLYTRRAVFNWFHGTNEPIWTSHDAGVEFLAQPAVDDAGSRDGASLSRRGDSNFSVWRRGEDALVFVTQGSTDHTQAPKFYEMDLNAAFPDYTGEDGDTAAPVSADLYTSDYWDAEGRELAVQSISVDYAYAPNEDQATNQIATFEVESLQLDNDARPRPGGAVAFSPPTTGASSEPGTGIVRGRATIPVRSSGSGNGFRIHVSNWKGLVIRNIVATVSVTKARP